MAQMMTGMTIANKFRVTNLIGIGGQADVAEALDTTNGQKVALKQLNVSPGSSNYAQELARFQRAGRIRVGSPHVVDPMDLFESHGDWYLVMPFVEGNTLANVITQHRGGLPWPHALRITEHLAKGLAAIHAKGLIHRDVKPGNVMVNPGGSACLLDLGICRDTSAVTITASNGMLGTPPYAAPEQEQDPRGVDHRADLYSLGVVLYHSLIGVQSQTAPAGAPWFPASVPPTAIQLCRRLVELDRNQRPGSAAEVVQTISVFMSAGSSAPAPASARCSTCGTRLEPSARYCAKCGAPSPVGVAGAAVVFCMACGGSAGSHGACPRCRRAFSHADHTLRFTSGALTGFVFRIPEGIYLVGRSELAGRDTSISRQHLSVACTNGVVFLQDAGSANKTYINRLPAEQPTRLAPGDELIVAGNTGTYTCN